MIDWKDGRWALGGKLVARVVWICVRDDWSAAGVAVGFSRFRFLDDLVGASMVGSSVAAAVVTAAVAAVAEVAIAVVSAAVTMVSGLLVSMMLL